MQTMFADSGSGVADEVSAAAADDVAAVGAVVVDDLTAADNHYADAVESAVHFADLAADAAEIVARMERNVANARRSNYFSLSSVRLDYSGSRRSYAV